MQANKLDLATSYVSRLQHCMVIWAIANYYCNRCHHSLVVKTQNETYIKLLTCPAEKLPTLRSSSVLTVPAASSTSEMALGYLSQFSFWLGPIVSFYTASLWRGQWWSIFRFCWYSAIVYSLGLSLTLSDQVRAGTAPVRGKGAVCTRMSDTSQTLPLALIGCVYQQAVDSCKSNYSHWVEPQTVDFYTADLYLLLLSDHNDNFCK